MLCIRFGKRMSFPNGIRSRNSFPTRKTAGFKAFKPMEPDVYSSVRTSRNPDFDLGIDFVDTLKPQYIFTYRGLFIRYL